MESEVNLEGGAQGASAATDTGSLGSTTSNGDPATIRERAPTASVSAGSPANSEQPQEPGEPPQGDAKSTEPKQGEESGEAQSVGDLLDGEGEEPGDKSADESGTLGAPEDGYKFEHVEGSVPIDDATLKEFGDVAKELNLSQEAAQKIVTKLEPMLQRSLERNRAMWDQATRTDAELGGANLKANLNAANRAYKQTTTPELRELLKVSGLVNHPEVVRHFYRLSKTLSDGAFITGGGMSERSAQTVFYKGMKNP